MATENTLVYIMFADSGSICTRPYLNTNISIYKSVNVLNEDEDDVLPIGTEQWKHTQQKVGCFADDYVTRRPWT